MVSIHRIPIVLYLTIRVLCFAFRFKREALYCHSLHALRPFHVPIVVKRATQKPHADMYNNPSILIVANGLWIHQWLYGI